MSSVGIHAADHEPSLRGWFDTSYMSRRVGRVRGERARYLASHVRVELYLTTPHQAYTYCQRDNSVSLTFSIIHLYGDMNMAKSAPVALSTSPFTSLKDSAFQQAGAAQTLESVAQFAIERIKGFPKDVPSEAKDELYEGYRMKFDALNPAKVYAVINDHYVLATQEHKDAKNVEKVEIGVAYAFSYSSQEFGKLANTRPALHALIKGVREKCSTYCSNRLGDLKRAASRILNEGKERQRSANKDFAEFVVDWFKDTAPTRLKSAKARSDKSADEKRFNEAKVAFMVKWNA